MNFIKKNKILLFVVLSVVLLFGCRSKKSTTSVTNEKQIDTVEVIIKQIDTVKITETKEVSKPIYIEQEIPCKENQKGKIGSGNNSVSYVVKDGYVRFNAEIDSCYTYYRELYESKLKDTLKSVRKEKEKVITETVEVVRYVYPWWVWLIGILGVIFLILWIQEKFSIFGYL